MGLEDVAASSSRFLLLSSGALVGEQHASDRLVEHHLEVLLGEGREFDVLDRTDFLGHGQSSLVGDGSALLLGQFLDGVGIVADGA